MGCNTSSVVQHFAPDKPALGVLRLDYNYPPNEGDIDSAASFGYDVQYKICKGLTFEMCKGGIPALTKEVQANFEGVIKEFCKNPLMMGITGDCGFMMAYQDIATRAAAGADVPVFMSSVLQCPLLAYTMEPGKKIAVLTADGESFVGIQESMLGSFRHSNLTMDRFKIVGCENVPHFKKNIDAGNRLPYDLIAPGIVELCKKTVEEDKDVRAILLECTELPPFADDIRASVKMPVLDAITCCDFYIAGVGGKNRVGTFGWGTLKEISKESGEHLLQITRTALGRMQPAEVAKMEDAPKLGVISPEGSHIADVKEKATFGYSIVHDVVKGLTVDMVRDLACKKSGMKLTDAVKEELHAKVRCLAQDHSCIGIAGSHGFMVVLQEFMRESAIQYKIPVFMSPLVQLPSLLRVMMPGSKVLILNADCTHFSPTLVTSYGFDIPPEHYVAKGCDLIPGFKEALRKTSEPIPAEFGPKIVELVKQSVAEDGMIYAVLLDSVSLIRFAERIRAETKLHVFDAGTMGTFFHAGFADNPRFGKMGWQKEV